MFDSKFSNMEHTLKEEKMRRIIKAKAKGITDEHVDEILDKIDFNKQYMIVCVYSLPSLLRNAHEEVGESFRVGILPVYGNIVPGIVTYEGDYEEPQAEDVPTSFIKSAEIEQDGKTYYEDTIFIYSE